MHLVGRIHLYYVRSNGTQPDIGVQSGWSCYFQTNNTIFLDKKKNNLLIVNYAHNFPEVGDNSKYFTNAYLDVGATTSVLANKVRIRLMFEDIFSQSWMRGIMFLDNNNFTFKNYYDARRFSLSLTYNLGGKNTRTSEQDIEFEENDRAH